VVRVLDAALCKADVTEVDLVKDHSLQDIGVLLKHSTLHPLQQTLAAMQRQLRSVEEITASTSRPAK
jgi:hypothetical protein